MSLVRSHIGKFSIEAAEDPLRERGPRAGSLAASCRLAEQTLLNTSLEGLAHVVQFSFALIR